MNILAHVELYPPYHNAGAEMMLHNILRWFSGRGYSANVLSRKAPQQYDIEGIRVEPETDNTDRLYAQADLVITHLGLTGRACNYSRKHEKPLFHLLHNTGYYSSLNVRKNNYIIFNSEWQKARLPFTIPNTICRPPVFPEDKKVKSEGDYITLVNLYDNKGGQQLINIAKEMPDYKFLGVEGSYGPQIYDRTVSNIDYIENQKDIREVLRKTKILLMPSKYESWGMMGVEAMINGIPVIANPTPGLKESLDFAGVFVDRDDTKGWVKAIENLIINKDYYKEQSELCLKRASELDPNKDLENLERFINSKIAVAV